MVNQTYSLFKTIKKATSFYGGSFKPAEPLPNSIAAKQMEQDEIAEEAANNPENQLAQTQKAQQTAVNDLQQAQQQIQELQGQLQQSQMVTDQQLQQSQAEAQQAIQKAQMDAEYQLQEEKIKNQKSLLTMQEKYMKGMQKQPKDQGGILGNQLSRIVAKVNKLNKAASQNIQQAAVPRAPVAPAALPVVNKQVSGAGNAVPKLSPAAPSNAGAAAVAKGANTDVTENKGYMSGLWNNLKTDYGSYIKNPSSYIGNNFSRTGIQDTAVNSVMGNAPGADASPLSKGVHWLGDKFVRAQTAPMDWLKNFAVDMGSNATGAVSHSMQTGYNLLGAVGTGAQRLGNYAVDAANWATQTGQENQNKAWNNLNKNWNSYGDVMNQHLGNAKNNALTGVNNLGNYGLNAMSALAPGGFGAKAIAAGAGGAQGNMDIVGGLKSLGGMFMPKPEDDRYAAEGFLERLDAKSDKMLADHQANNQQPWFNGADNNPYGGMMPTLQGTMYQSPQHTPALNNYMQPYQGPQSYEFIKDMLLNQVGPLLGIPNPLQATPDFNNLGQNLGYRPAY